MSNGDSPTRPEHVTLDLRSIQLIIDGDEDGLRQLYDRHAPLAFGMAMTIVHERSDAEDVVHDAFLAIVERADQYRAERGSVLAWLVTTVRNLSLDRVRGRLRRARITEATLRHEPHEPVPVPESRAWLAGERERVRAALAALPEVQRRTLHVAFFEGLTYAEIAERDGVSLGTVKSRAARAIAALRGVLGG